MKAVLRSIKPYWLYLILIGEKTIEVGKDFPKADDWSRAVFLYCSKDKKSFNRIPEKDREWMRKYLGKVACKFVCDRIINIPYIMPYDIEDTSHPMRIDFIHETCVPDWEIDEYLGKKDGFGWHISDLVIYDEPRELGEFVKYRDDWGFRAGIAALTGLDCNEYLTRPFQSWGYVEGKE